MLTTRRNQDLMPSLIDELMNWNTPMFESNYASMPKMNVSESEKDYLVEICVPGLKKEDLTINMDNGNMVVEMSKKDSKSVEDKDRRYLRREFGACAFRQSFGIPENVKREEIAAHIENGVLRITLPKMTEDEKRGNVKIIEIG